MYCNMERMVNLNRSTFPQSVDIFAELYDLPPSLTMKAKRYQELKMKPTLNALEQSELNGITTELDGYIVTPETWNKMADAIQNVESFFIDNTKGYIEGKQLEWDGYVKNLKDLGVYSASTSYVTHNMVTYNGDLYICLKNCKGVVPTTVSNWRKLSSKGEKGDVGLGTYLKGYYSNTTAYVIGDAVIFNNNLYYCIKNTTAGTTPNVLANWYLFSGTVVSPSKPVSSRIGLHWIQEVE